MKILIALIAVLFLMACGDSYTTICFKADQNAESGSDSSSDGADANSEGGDGAAAADAGDANVDVTDDDSVSTTALTQNGEPDANASSQTEACQ